MRGIGIGMMMILLALFAGSVFVHSNTQTQPNRPPALLNLGTDQGSKVLAVPDPSSTVEESPTVTLPAEISATETVPTVVAPEPEVSAASLGVVTSIPATPVPLATKVVEQNIVGGQSQPVLITFYYCQRTIERSDDGGGYCGGTSHGGIAHAGTAACPITWSGRTFTIVGNTIDQVYKCEDTGSAVISNQVDIWFATNGEGWAWPLRGAGTIIWQD